MTLSEEQSTKLKGVVDSRFRKLTAIVRIDVLEKVEETLKNMHVPGITVSKVKGYGQYVDFFRGDWMVENARIEIFTRHERTDEIVRAIIASAHAGLPGDGLVVVYPVE